jgi:hypothetical protein
MPTLSASQCRIFWLALPPLKPSARLDAARLALRSRLANPNVAQFALSNAAAPNGHWCAAVTDSAMQGVPVAALTPWVPHTVSWRYGVDPHCITSRGDSVALDPVAEFDIPDPVVMSVAQAQGCELHIIVDDAATAAQLAPSSAVWAAQLGVPVQIGLAATTAAKAAATAVSDPWLPDMQHLHPLHLATAAPKPRSHWAAGVAAAAGLAHVAFSAAQFLSARQHLHIDQTRIDALALQTQTPATQWRARIAQSHPNAARDSAEALLSLSASALMPISGQLKSLSVQSRALSLEWNTLSEAQREAFVANIESRGASVVSAGNKARVFWP